MVSVGPAGMKSPSESVSYEVPLVKAIEVRNVGEQIRRRYECKRCNVRFTTHERVDDANFNDHLKMAIKLLQAAMKTEAV